MKTHLFFLVVTLLVIRCGAVQYGMTCDQEFIDEIRDRASFPAAPMGGCADGTMILSEFYMDLPIEFAYNPENRGHVWLLVGDPMGRYVALDSYYGVVRDPWYYNPPVVTDSHKELVKICQLLRPKGRSL